MVELVDTLDLGSSAARCGGSSPLFGTIYQESSKMSLISVFSFAIAMFILAATPGPGVFAIISRSLASGFKTTLVMIAGCITGDIIFLLSSIMGMAVVAQTLGNLFILVKIIGGIYLIFLGIRIWMKKPVPIQKQNNRDQKTILYGKYSGTLRKSQTWRLCSGHYLSGLGITLANPKVILFYCGFLPTLLNLSSMTNFDIVIVTLVLAIVLSIVLIFYAYIASSARVFFSSTGSVKWLNRTSGTIMVTAGIAITARS